MGRMKASELATRKAKVEFLYSDILVKDAFDKLEKKRFAMIPVLERKSNRYLYSLSEGDILRFIVETGNLRKAGKKPLSRVSIDRLIVPVKEEDDVSALFDLAPNQSYIPLIDENGVFKGIVTRKSIIYHLLTTSNNQGE